MASTENSTSKDRVYLSHRCRYRRGSLHAMECQGASTRCDEVVEDRSWRKAEPELIGVSNGKARQGRVNSLGLPTLSISSSLRAT